jgi:class 3 adenylate cyclase
VADVPATRYAKTPDGVHVAYQTVGEGPLDLVLVEGFISHLDIAWEDAGTARFRRELASFARLVLFDKRGVGLSDRVPGVPTLEQRMDDIVAVMDAAGVDRAVLMGLSEGAPASLLFAATYPERTRALVLHGGMARSTWAPDYPWATPADALIESVVAFEPEEVLFEGTDIETWAPSLADDERAMAWLGRFRRSSITPGALGQLFLMFLEIDVRAVLPTITVPTLVIHRRGDRVVDRHAGEWMASQIPGARYVEVPGSDHFPWTGDTDAVLSEVEEFITGARHVAEPDRVLATVLFTDIVGSTDQASAVGDRAWRETLDQHDALVASVLERHRGRTVKSTGDGVLATFDGPGRAIRCALELHEALAPIGINIRAGLHTGEVEVRGDDVGGIAVHIAARVEAAAAPGEVLVSRTVSDLVVGSGIGFEDRGVHALKGVPGEWQLFAVRG